MTDFDSNRLVREITTDVRQPRLARGNTLIIDLPYRRSVLCTWMPELVLYAAIYYVGRAESRLLQAERTWKLTEAPEPYQEVAEWVRENT